jgi:alkanesulfonate monooxygenase SsuD/methylene tetrahydromethanopterin reductase-like flavin-dependent oxidoreductase (luciferase family)
VLSALTAVTSRIGLAATAITTYTEPYNLARYFASIDYLSGGRPAWNVVTEAFPEAAENFGRVPHPDHSARYAMADEFVKVVKGLWDSWEEVLLLPTRRRAVISTRRSFTCLTMTGPIIWSKVL